MAAGLAEVVDGDEGGVVEASEGTGLAAEAQQFAVALPQPMNRHLDGAGRHAQIQRVVAKSQGSGPAADMPPL